MSDNQQTKRPSHLAYQINEGRDGQVFFNRVGAAFEHQDGQGFNLVLDSVPVDGKVTLRTPKERLDNMRCDDRQDNDRPRRRERGRDR